MTLPRRSGRCCSSTPAATSTTSCSTGTSARSCTPRRSGCCEAHELAGADPAADPAAHRRGLHPRPLVLAGRDDLPDPAGHGRDVGRGPARAGRPGDRRRGRRHRHPLDVLAGAVHRPGPALGPGQRDVRRGPVPHRRARRRRWSAATRATAWTTRPRSSRRAKHFAGYSETQGGRDASEADISPAQAALVVPAAVRAGRRARAAATFMLGYQSMDGVPITVNDWLLNDVLRGEWGYTGHARHRLGQRRPHGLGAARPARLRARGRGGRAGRQRHGHDHARRSSRARWRPSRGPARPRPTSTPPSRRILTLKFELGLFENPRHPDAGAPARGDRLRRARRAEPRGGPPLARAAAQRRHAAAAAAGATPLTTVAVVGPHADDAADAARRLGRRLRPGRLAARRPAARDDHDRARRVARASSPPAGRSRTPAAPTSSRSAPTRRARPSPTASRARRSCSPRAPDDAR